MRCGCSGAGATSKVMTMKTHSRFIFAGIAIAMALASAMAHGVLSINEPWVRAAADGRSAEVFMNLESSESATLIGVDSFAARKIAIRAPGGRRTLPELALPANVLVAMRPDSVRIGLEGLVRRLKLGEHVPVTLIVRSADGRRQLLYINAEVRRRSPTEDELIPHGHPPHGK
jgi:copper(I)-binding protein